MTGDEYRLRQVLANLLENARTHTPPTTPVEVRVGVAGDDAVIEVQRPRPGHDAPKTRRACSSGSGAPTRRGARRAAAPASGSRSSPRSPRRTAVAPKCRPRPGPGATFRVWIPRSGPAANAPAPGASDQPAPDPDFELLPEVQPEPEPG